MNVTFLLQILWLFTISILQHESHLPNSTGFHRGISDSRKYCKHLNVIVWSCTHRFFCSRSHEGYRIWRPWRSSTFNLSVLDESTFRRALDEFSSAEMRFGKWAYCGYYLVSSAIRITEIDKVFSWCSVSESRYNFLGLEANCHRAQPKFPSSRAMHQCTLGPALNLQHRVIDSERAEWFGFTHCSLFLSQNTYIKVIQRLPRAIQPSICEIATFMESFKDNSLATDATQQLPPLPEASLLSKPNSRPSSRSPSRSPRRVHSDPSGDVVIKTYKRIIVCCDG